MADSDVVGTIAWANPDYAKSSDYLYATNQLENTGNQPVIDVEVKIVKADGSIGTTNKADTNVWIVTDAQTYQPYGDNTDLWGETWTAANINDADFGVVLSAKETTTDITSHYLKATNFGFAIPTGAVINGIIVEIKRWDRYSGGFTYAYVNHIKITVYYTD